MPNPNDLLNPLLGQDLCDVTTHPLMRVSLNLERTIRITIP